MEVIILGSGTATPSLERNASGLVVKTAGLHVLVDMGPGTLRRMCEAGIDAKLIDAILITHFHPDHVSDLVPFLFASNYAFGPVREEAFNVIGPEGLEQFYEGLVGVYNDWIIPRGNRLKKVEMNNDGPDGYTLGRLNVRSMPSVHASPSVSYRLEAEEVSLTVTGDTDVSDGLIELAGDTDLLICECSLPNGQKVPGHLIPAEAGLIATRSGAKKLILTHFYPPCDEADVAAQAASCFSGEIVKARDLMVITV